MDKNKTYRCILKPSSKHGFGRWEYEYNGKWHEVVNYQIRAELNKQAGYYDN